MIRTFAAAALFAITAIPAAHASTTTPREVVAYGDLDRSSMAGRSELKARLEDAAAKVCSPLLTPPDSEPTAREHQIVYRACIGRHTNRAMAQIDAQRN